MFSVLPHSTFTVQILYKLYSHHQNCNYNKYTQAAALCSVCYRAARLMYKLCSHHLKCTYGNYKKAAAICSACYCVAHLL